MPYSSRSPSPSHTLPVSILCLLLAVVHDLISEGCGKAFPSSILLMMREGCGASFIRFSSWKVKC